MKVLLVNGSPDKAGCVNRALSEVIDELHRNGIETEMMWLGKTALNDCMDCGYCFTHEECVFKDVVNDASEKLKTCDGLIVGTPTYYGGENGRVASFLSRLFYSNDASLFATKAAACVVSARRGGASSAFMRMNQWFLMNNMFVIGSQYWNQVHGLVAEDVEKDEEGLQTMRTLAKNMAYYLKLKENGKETVKEVEYEEVTPTHFIQ